ncbi:M20 aminoacylase family protein [Salinisphaera sp. SPP-AMP-43]|uniref:M20 aminoacylase family protein n=1 Tax=Salinisphaera sp. SPP-AMP-43 TaxID=3121288 RepID=UPI003C6DE899
MPTLPEIEAWTDELVAIRRDIHAHPEIGFEEQRTSALVADKLTEWGIDVHRGIGSTGLVGVVEGRRPGPMIGLRADMDALPMDEQTGLEFASQNPGRFHGCGHDGHTTMLLGAARYLANNRDFAGTAVTVFQPAEEGLGGGRAMIADDLFGRFPCREIYALHNAPHLAPGQVGIAPGKAMAAAHFFDIHIHGRGSHAAMPEGSRDALVIASALAQSLQSIVARNVSPMASAVLSITQLHAGSAYNVIPETATLAGTIRYFDEAVGDLVAARVREIANGIAVAHGVDIEVDIRNVFSVLDNHPAETAHLQTAAADIVGHDGVLTAPAPMMGSEDFADMLHAVPGAYCWVGHGGDLPLHNPGFILDETILPVGASVLARVAESRLSTG